MGTSVAPKRIATGNLWILIYIRFDIQTEMQPLLPRSLTSTRLSLCFVCHSPKTLKRYVVPAEKALKQNAVLLLERR